METVYEWLSVQDVRIIEIGRRPRLEATARIAAEAGAGAEVISTVYQGMLPPFRPLVIEVVIDGRAVQDSGKWPGILEHLTSSFSEAEARTQIKIAAKRAAARLAEYTRARTVA